MKFQSTRQQQTALSLTVYNDGFGLVKETRTIPANKEVTEIQFMDVASGVETESVLVDGIHVLEQSYNYDLINKEKLLEKYMDDVITVRNAELDEEMQIRLLCVYGSIIGERVDTKEVVIDPIGELILPSLPEGLLTKPALIWKTASIETDLEAKVSYLTQGLEWQASYVAEIRGSQLTLSGWVQLSNNSGMSFFDSRLKLASGKVNRYVDARPIHEQARLFAKAEESESAFREHSFADYHAYSIERPVTLLHGQTKQISFYKAQDVAFRKIYKVEPGSQQAKVIVEFDNTSANHMGVPLPKGIFKVYEQDRDGEMEFIGENAIGHTAAQQEVSVVIGEAFDIISKNWEKRRGRHGHFDYVTYVYKLQNRKSEYVRIEVNHQIHERIWQMESSSHDYELKKSNELEFRVRIPAGKEAEVEFTYKVDRSADEHIK
ncbi:hypothetical protein A1A1_15493 [Planococcus antarcticus DSM 14505]|uniref:DUF4139 domain-containing protein n=1 Tax=Planococcus antarcticus DSM 14505 TaxID=1185653 RepID=A0A1C7DC51_9BACL|nr:DUF4139 domain-containing protein [Planococcus antarcticus]ANU09066.1 DUF4139 domain-containing protein [Planococcus antarcticus DSM 14505]EIM05571.1 hypothetical protein A1A1_15493 [Planococcus antarcticus DSM 14505]